MATKKSNPGAKHPAFLAKQQPKAAKSAKRAMPAALKKAMKKGGRKS